MHNLLAALMFFSRLPFWRICSVPSECFRHVVSYWSLCGWLTGGVMALAFWLFSLWFPIHVAVLLALCARLFLIGRFLRRFWRRTRSGRDSSYHEGLPYRELRSAGADSVLSVVVFPACFFTGAGDSLGVMGGRSFLQVCLQFHVGRKQGQDGLYPHEYFGVGGQCGRGTVASVFAACCLLGDAVVSLRAFCRIGVFAQASAGRIYRRLLRSPVPVVRVGVLAGSGGGYL